MPFAELMTDTISVFDERGNLVKESIRASVQSGRAIHTLGADFPVAIGYFVERKLPTGVIEKYKVLEPNYYGDFHSIKAHYQMKVINVNAIPDPRLVSTINTINASGNARVYQHSVDSSINHYTSNDLVQILKQIKSDVLEIDLSDIDLALTTKAISKVSEEIEKPEPNKDKIFAYISLLPATVATLESVLNLASMLGLTI